MLYVLDAQGVPHVSAEVAAGPSGLQHMTACGEVVQTRRAPRLLLTNSQELCEACAATPTDPAPGEHDEEHQEHDDT